MENRDARPLELVLNGPLHLETRSLVLNLMCDDGFFHVLPTSLMVRSLRSLEIEWLASKAHDLKELLKFLKDTAGTLTDLTLGVYGVPVRGK